MLIALFITGKHWIQIVINIIDKCTIVCPKSTKKKKSTYSIITLCELQIQAKIILFLMV